MTPEDLATILQGLAAGHIKTMSRGQFEQVFERFWTLEDRKVAAVALAERCHCAVLFTQTSASFARFTKRQDRSHLQTAGREQLLPGSQKP